MKQLLAILSLAIVVASCNTKYEKTKSGLSYKIFKGDGKEKLKQGQIIKINGKVTIAGRDTVLFTTYGRLPEYMPFDTSIKDTHDFKEVLKNCSVGDSLVTISQVDTLVKRGSLQYSDFLKRGDQIVTSIKILKVLNSEEDRAKDQQAEVEKEKARELAEVQSYITKNKVQAQKTPSGLFIEVKNPGSEVKGVQGKQVTVNYKGTLMSNGVVFDTNMDTSFKHKEPFTFVNGQGQVIPAWEEALPYFGVGGSGRIFVPALMAYGPAGQGPIPPYSNLIFEIQVTNVGDAPKEQPQQQQMDPQMLEELKRQMQQQQSQPPQQQK